MSFHTVLTKTLLTVFLFCFVFFFIVALLPFQGNADQHTVNPCPVLCLLCYRGGLPDLPVSCLEGKASCFHMGKLPSVGRFREELRSRTFSFKALCRQMTLGKRQNLHRLVGVKEERRVRSSRMLGL